MLKKHNKDINRHKYIYYDYNYVFLKDPFLMICHQNTSLWVSYVWLLCEMSWTAGNIYNTFGNLQCKDIFGQACPWHASYLSCDGTSGGGQGEGGLRNTYKIMKDQKMMKSLLQNYKGKQTNS